MTTSESDRRDSGKEDGPPQPAEHRPSHALSAEQARHRDIQVAAYYVAERRGFAGNRALEDWLEAERRIDSRAADAGVKHEASMLTQPLDGELPPGAGGDAPLAEQERERIEPGEVKRWAAELSVPAPRLRDAIKKVGPFVDDVRRFLESSRS